MYDKTSALMQRGREFLGSEWAIMCGAMSWVSERNLVSAISNAGGFGVIACGAMPPEMLDAEIAATRALTSRPFGVNLITMHPQLFDLIAVCAKHAVSHVVLAGGIPPKGSVEAIKVFVVRKDPQLTEAALLAYCHENLTGYKVPRRIEFRDELPKSNVGKILRRQLRDDVASSEA